MSAVTFDGQDITSGRLSSEGAWPTRLEWVEAPALPRDLIFNDEDEVQAAFMERFADIDRIMRSSSVTREELITGIMNLTSNRPDLVSAVDFSRLPTRSSDGSYASKTALDEADGSISTFSATIKTLHNPSRPKESIIDILATDHVVRGLAMPYLMSLRFRIAHQPWTIGISNASQGALWLNVPGKNNEVNPPFETEGLWKLTDPEAIDQTLEFCAEVAKEIFSGPTTESPETKALHQARKIPRFAPNAYSPLRFIR